jgi:hypothetical protein
MHSSDGICVPGFAAVQSMSAWMDGPKMGWLEPEFAPETKKQMTSEKTGRAGAADRADNVGWCRSAFRSLALVVVLAAACTRPAAINQDASYTLVITNPQAHAMNLAVNTGSGLVVLGLVDAGQTREFELRNPGTNDVTLVATGGPNALEIRKKIELRRAQPARITLTN